jgi:hypothetical protein
LNSWAVASAWSSVSEGAPSGVQQLAGAEAVVVAVIGVPYIERCRYDHAIMHRHLSM